MAGIGFDLRDAVELGATTLTRVRAWASACLISSGPWIVTVCVLTYLQAIAPLLSGAREHDIFHGLVTWCFAFSLLVVAVVQMPVARALADQLWRREHHLVLPGLVSTLAVTGGIQVLVGGVFTAFLPISPAARLLAVSLYVCCTWTWIALIWIGVTRDVTSALRAYLLGAAVTVSLTACTPLRGTLEGLLTTFFAGQALTLVLLLASIVRGVHGSRFRGPAAIAGVVERPLLVAVGLLYGVGMWADKFVFWAVDGLSILGPLRHHPLYDSCSFLAYVTVVPALAIHLVRTETSFYEIYRTYYDTILQDGTLDEIVAARHRVFETLRGSVFRLVRVQAWFTAAAVILAPEILPRLGMPPGAVPVFRTLCLGAYFHVLFLLTVLVLLYFDRQLQALRAAAVFCALNVLFPWIVSQGSPAGFGVGYTLACLAGLITGFNSLQRDLGRLEYLTMSSSALAR